MKMSIGSLIAAAAGLFFCSLAGNASAQGWQGAYIKGHAAVASGTTVYALSNNWVTNKGWSVQIYDFTQPNNGVQTVGTEGGTSIALDYNGYVWVSRADNVIKFVDGPNSYNGPNCNGNFTFLRQDPGHTNLAFVGTSNQPYHINVYGRVLTWAGSCWQELPLLP
ncbi:MAG: hypothetical protein ABW061_08805, partial [Polyangiaceae bacterium]